MFFVFFGLKVAPFFVVVGLFGQTRVRYENGIRCLNTPSVRPTFHLFAGRRIGRRLLYAVQKHYRILSLFFQQLNLLIQFTNINKIVKHTSSEMGKGSEAV